MCEHHRIAASLPISAGWITSGPSRSQFLLPLTEMPRLVWVIASSTTATTSAGQANARSTRCGSRDATKATGSASSTQVSCRRNQ